jgi:hypothetical protein
MGSGGAPNLNCAAGPTATVLSGPTRAKAASPRAWPSSGLHDLPPPLQRRRRARGRHLPYRGRLAPILPPRHHLAQRSIPRSYSRRGEGNAGRRRRPRCRAGHRQPAIIGALGRAEALPPTRHHAPEASRTRPRRLASFPECQEHQYLDSPLSPPWFLTACRGRTRIRSRRKKGQHPSFFLLRADHFSRPRSRTAAESSLQHKALRGLSSENAPSRAQRAGRTGRPGWDVSDPPFRPPGAAWKGLPIFPPGGQNGRVAHVQR